METEQVSPAEPAPEELVTLAGELGAGEYGRAAEHHRGELLTWLRRLPELDDRELLDEAESAIHGSALMASFRGNWEHVHCRNSAAQHEARRRHRGAGHGEHCRGADIYDRAYFRWADDPAPLERCDCGGGR